MKQKLRDSCQRRGRIEKELVLGFLLSWAFMYRGLFYVRNLRSLRPLIAFSSLSSLVVQCARKEVGLGHSHSALSRSLSLGCFRTGRSEGVPLSCSEEAATAGSPRLVPGGLVSLSPGRSPTSGHSWTMRRFTLRHRAACSAFLTSDLVCGSAAWIDEPTRLGHFDSWRSRQLEPLRRNDGDGNSSKGTRICMYALRPLLSLHNR